MVAVKVSVGCGCRGDCGWMLIWWSHHKGVYCWCELDILSLMWHAPVLLLIMQSVDDVYWIFETQMKRGSWLWNTLCKNPCENGIDYLLRIAEAGILHVSQFASDIVLCNTCSHLLCGEYSFLWSFVVKKMLVTGCINVCNKHPTKELISSICQL